MLSFDTALNATSGLEFPLGEDTSGSLIKADLARTPHLLIAGATGTGKSTLLHGILLTLLAHNPASRLRLILCDTKIVELNVYAGVKNLVSSIASRPWAISSAVDRASDIIQSRLLRFAKMRVPGIGEYNDLLWSSFSSEPEMPHIVLVIDDLATALAENREIEKGLLDIVANGRAAGVHLFAITQAPASREAKAVAMKIINRVVFTTSTKLESEKLTGSSAAFGLAQYGKAITYSAGHTEIISVAPIYGEDFKKVLDSVEKGEAILELEEDSSDELLPAAIEVVFETGMASVSMIQRKLNLKYQRAARIMDEIEKLGVVGPFDGAKPREILLTKSEWEARRSGGGSEGKLSEHSDAQPLDGQGSRCESDAKKGNSERRKHPLRRILFGK